MPIAGTLSTLRSIETIKFDAVASDPGLVLDQRQVQLVVRHPRNDSFSQTAIGAAVERVAGPSAHRMPTSGRTGRVQS